MSEQIPIQPKSSSKRTQDEISKNPTPNFTPPITPRSNTSSPIGLSPPRKIIAPSILEKDMLQGDRDARNLKLAHDIAFDGNLKLNEKSQLHSDDETASLHFSDVEGDEADSGKISQNSNPILKKLQEAYWDKIQQDINEDEWNVIISPLKEIKTAIFDLLPKRKITSIHKDLEEKIDFKIIENQIENDTFDLNEFKNNIIIIIDIMSKVCAPVRDEKINQLRLDLTKAKKYEITKILDSIFKLVKLMNIDMANFSIKAIRPYIQKQQIEYERNKMHDYLKKNPEKGLEHSKAWLKIAFLELKNLENEKLEDNYKQDPENVEKPDPNNNISPIGPNKVLDQAFYNLIVNPPASYENWVGFFIDIRYKGSSLR